MGLLSNRATALRLSASLPTLVGIVLLAAALCVVYFLEMLFAESHLASYYCCLMPEELARIDPLERAVSDFFRTAPGQWLPGGLFILGNLGVLIHALRRGANLTWLPLWFALGLGAYIVVDFVLVQAGHTISHWVVGPQTTAYKGYQRTWYGIALHGALWVGYFGVLVRFARSSRVSLAHGLPETDQP